MATDDWTNAERQAIDVRDLGEDAVESLDEPKDSIDRAAFWSRVEAMAEARKWDALADAKNDGYPWWRLGSGRREEPGTVATTVLPTL